ncbi:hypothetical protein [Acinetobacter baumannii]|uniref:hypothetical protein n=1 Tax=Acinetobacter baumannii TaxID=470 RepID=UPI00148CBB8B|nr:hypothetical protein [Acinetobacter baumannii]
MKATKLIRDKGLQYAKEIVDSAPSNGVKVFKYECTDYSLEINYNPERSSFMIFKEI